MIIILRHVFFTWLVAHAIHPFLMILFWEGISMDSLSIVLSYWLMGIFLSIPTILILWVINQSIITSGLSVTSKFIVWLASASFIVALNAFLVMMLIAGEYAYLIYHRMLMLGSPSVVSIAASIVILHHQFFQLNKSVLKL